MDVEKVVIEIRDLSRGSPMPWRAAIANRLLDLYLVHDVSLTRDQVDLFDRLFLTLFQQMDAPSLQQVGKRLAVRVAEPMQAIVTLAGHPEIDVARFVLETATCLVDSDLAAIVSSASLAHGAAIAGRSHVSAEICTLLIERGGPAIIARLAANAGARLSELAFTALIGHAAKDKRLAATMAARADVPAELRSFFTLSMA